MKKFSFEAVLEKAIVTNIWWRWCERLFHAV